MSVFGGDSWAREAQYRKRRVDDLLVESIEASVYKKLPSGKFACLVCPNNPVLDSSIMLSTHMSGSRHRAAELRLKDREIAVQEELKKRLALSECVSTSAAIDASTKLRKTTSKPLIERTRKAAIEVLRGEVSLQKVKSEIRNSAVPRIGELSSNANSTVAEAMHEEVVEEVHPINYRERIDRELKFTAAGWKRDGHGRWYKDENVEFDSDEEDPNIVLKEAT